MPKINLKKKFQLAYTNRKKLVKKIGGMNMRVEEELTEAEPLENDARNALWVQRKMNEANNEIENSSSGDIIINLKPIRKLFISDATADTIVDMPFTETYEGDFNENRREEHHISNETSDNKRDEAG